jgi:hypothetical protein
MKCMHAHPPSVQLYNLFKFNRMKNRTREENLLKSRLTTFILNNITGSMTMNMGVRSQ